MYESLWIPEVKVKIVGGEKVSYIETKTKGR